MWTLFKSKSFFAWKSLRLVVFELCSSEIKFTYNFKWIVAFIWITTGRKATYKLLQEEQVIWNLNRRCKVFTEFISYAETMIYMKSIPLYQSCFEPVNIFHQIGGLILALDLWRDKNWMILSKRIWISYHCKGGT